MRMVADACRRHGVKPCLVSRDQGMASSRLSAAARLGAACARAIGDGQFYRYVKLLHHAGAELLTTDGDIGVTMVRTASEEKLDARRDSRRGEVSRASDE